MLSPDIEFALVRMLRDHQQGKLVNVTGHLLTKNTMLGQTVLGTRSLSGFATDDEISGLCSGPCWTPCSNPIVFRVGAGTTLNQVTTVIGAVTVLTSATTITNRFRNIRIDENGCYYIGEPYCAAATSCTSGPDTPAYWCYNAVCYTVYDGITPDGMTGPFATPDECVEACSDYWCCATDGTPYLVLVTAGSPRPTGCTGTYATLQEALDSGCIPTSGPTGTYLCAYTVSSPDTAVCLEDRVWSEATTVFGRYSSIEDCQAACSGGMSSCCSRALDYLLTATVSGNGSMYLVWNGTNYWTGSKALVCGETLYLRFTLSCTLEYSCDGVTWLPTTTGIGELCGPPYASGTFGAINMNTGTAGCNTGACGTLTATVGE